jgi:uncharacterized protein (DUF1800 family)
MLDQTYIDTAHLLRRAGFGAAPDEIKAAASRGLAHTTDDLLHPERVPEPDDDDATIARLTALIPEQQRTDKQGDEFLPLQVVKMWWVQRMIATKRPLVEKMTLFWHGHFTSKLPARQGEDMYRQNRMFRQNALGNFRTLTLAVSRDPAMLKYLNGNQNFKAHPNENYGRELMELYTCGIGNYTENDVKASSRAFSGWNLRRDEFFFNVNQHDNTPKTFLGKTGDWNGDDIVDMLVAHPATARRLCMQIFQYLAYPDPEPAVLDALVKTYYGSGYDIGAIVGQILRSKAFYSDKARYAVIKCPAQYVVGTVKMLGLSQAVSIPPAEITAANDTMNNPGASPAVATADQRRNGQRLGMLRLLPFAMRKMGQDLLEPPSVKGWDGGPDWINSSTLLARIDFANLISQSRLAFDGQFVRAAAYVRQNDWDAAGWVDYLAQTLGPLPLTPKTRQALIDYANGSDGDMAVPAQSGVQNTAFEQSDTTEATPRYRRGRRQAALGGGLAGIRIRTGKKATQGLPAIAGPGGLEGRIRSVIPLMMATPEYQVC